MLCRTFALCRCHDGHTAVINLNQTFQCDLNQTANVPANILLNEAV